MRNHRIIIGNVALPYNVRAEVWRIIIAMEIGSVRAEVWRGNDDDASSNGGQELKITHTPPQKKPNVV